MTDHDKASLTIKVGFIQSFCVLSKMYFSLNKAFVLVVGRCAFGRMTYEKVSGYELDRGHSYLLYRDAARGISDRCAKRCQSDIRCHAFNLDYNRNECSALEFANDEVRYDLRRSSGVAYFEGICLRGKLLSGVSVYLV